MILWWLERSLLLQSLFLAVTSSSRSVNKIDVLLYPWKKLATCYVHACTQVVCVCVREREAESENEGKGELTPWEALARSFLTTTPTHLRLLSTTGSPETTSKWHSTSSSVCSAVATSTGVDMVSLKRATCCIHTHKKNIRVQLELKEIRRANTKNIKNSSSSTWLPSWTVSCDWR